MHGNVTFNRDARMEMETADLCFVFPQACNLLIRCDTSLYVDLHGCELKLVSIYIFV